jgi:uncharacterized membrane protein YhdT
LVVVVMEVPDTESNSRELSSVIRGDLIVNRMSRLGLKGGRPFRLRVGSAGWVRDLFASHQSPGASGRINWFELGLTALAWVLMIGVVFALLYFCYRLALFVAYG